MICNAQEVVLTAIGKPILKDLKKLIAGISKCDAFKSSLKTINISGCEMSRKTALEILKKYQLDGIKLEI